VNFSFTVAQKFEEPSNLGVIFMPKVLLANSYRSTNSAELGELNVLKDLENSVPAATEGLNHI
jgi:hypothetical protein